MAEMEKKGRRREEESGVWLSIDKGGVNKHLYRGPYNTCCVSHTHAQMQTKESQQNGDAAVDFFYSFRVRISDYPFIC